MSRIKDILTFRIKRLYVLLGTLITLVLIYFFVDFGSFYSRIPTSTGRPRTEPAHPQAPDSLGDDNEQPAILVGYWLEHFRYQQPIKIVQGPSREFYVLDRMARKVLTFTADGTFIKELDIWRYNDDSFKTRERDSGDNPQDIAIDIASNIYILYTGARSRDQVQKYSSEGNIVKIFSNLDRPTSIAVDGLNSLYVASMNGDISKFDAEGRFIRRLGTKGKLPGQFWFVGDWFSNRMAIDKDNNIYIVDTGNNRIQKYDKKGNFMLDFGISGVENGQLDSPSDIGIAIDGNLHIVDRGNKRIQIFSPDGKWLGKWGKVKDKFIPSSIMFDLEGKAYLVSMGNRLQCRIQVFTVPRLNASKVTQISLKPQTAGLAPFIFTERWPEYFESRPTKIVESPLGQIYFLEGEKEKIWRFASKENRSDFRILEHRDFFRPGSMTVDKDSNLYVLSRSYDGVVLKFDPEGNFLKKLWPAHPDKVEVCWGLKGMYPTSIAVDSGGNLYLVDARLNCIHRLNPEGNFIESWNGEKTKPDRSRGLPLENRAIAIDKSDNVYVLDIPTRVIRKFRSDGRLTGEFGSIGSDDGQFNRPSDIAVGSDGKLYVVDELKHRIEIFSPDGQFLGKWGKRGFGDGELEHPQSIMLDKKGNAYVISSGVSRGYRIQIFGPSSK